MRGRENYYPRQLSGGQQQRVGIARSLVVEPDLWFLDEPFSALDPLIRREMQDEFIRLQNLLKKTIVFITHDFGVVEDIADQVLVMYKGRIVEQGKAKNLIRHPKHPYTKALLQCIPSIHSKKTLKPIDYQWLQSEMEKI